MVVSSNQEKERGKAGYCLYVFPEKNQNVKSPTKKQQQNNKTTMKWKEGIKRKERGKESYVAGVFFPFLRRLELNRNQFFFLDELQDFIKNKLFKSIP